MNRKILVLSLLCCFLLSSCSKPAQPYISEVRSKNVDARSGQAYAQYAVYNPALSVDIGIDAADVEFASTGTYLLLRPTEEDLKHLAGSGLASLYYNQRGQIIIEIKGN